MLKNLNFPLLAALVFCVSAAQAEPVDLRTFTPDTESGRIERRANLATLTQISKAGEVFQGQANIFSERVTNVVSFEYRISGRSSIAEVAAGEDARELEPHAGRFSTFRFLAPYSGNLAFSIQGLGGYPEPVVPGTGTLTVRNLLVGGAGDVKPKLPTGGNNKSSN